MTKPRANVSGISRPAAGIAISTRRLIRLRIDKGWNRPRLAEAAGLSTSMINKIENDERRPGAATLAALCAALGCTTADLLLEDNRQQGDNK